MAKAKLIAASYLLVVDASKVSNKQEDSIPGETCGICLHRNNFPVTCCYGCEFFDGEAIGCNSDNQSAIPHCPFNFK